MRLVIRDLFDPPTNWMPEPPKLLITRVLVGDAGEKTTLWTLAPITKPLVKAGVPTPDSVSASFTATRVAFEIVIPWSGTRPPTAPENVIGPPAEAVNRLAPSTVDEKAMALPVERETFSVTVTSPWKVAAPVGALSSAPSWMPLVGPLPAVVNVRAPAPLVATELATTIESETPAPVSMLSPWAAPPLVTAARLTPPGPIVTASCPAAPTTEMPAKVLIAERSTRI